MIRFLAAVIFATGAAAFAAGPEPTDKVLLFEGPAPGQVVYKALSNWTTADCTILFVTKDAAFLRIKDTVKVIEPKRHEVSRLDGKLDGKTLLWTVDANKQFTGTTMPYQRPDVRGSSYSGDQSKYLYYLAGRLQDTVDQAIARNDALAIKQLRSRIEDLIEHAKKVKAEPAVVKLFEALPGYIDRQAETAKARMKFLDDHLEKIELNRITDEEAKLKSEMEKMKGLAQYYKGAFPRVTTRLGRGSTTWVSYDYGGAMAGVANMMRANLMYEHDRLRISHAKRLMDKEKEKQLDAFSETMATAKLERIKAVAEVGETAYGLPRAKDVVAARELFDHCYGRGDYGELLKLMGNRSLGEERSLSVPNPFTSLDTSHIAARYETGTKAEHARRTFDSAVRAVQLTAHIPDDKIFDADRADVLRSAAALALMAALAESTDGSIGSAYSPSAAFAVRCLERASEFQGLDLDGTLREQKALANAAAGRLDEAYRLVQEIRGMRKGVVDFLITYARVASANEKTKDALDALQDAVEQGYNDIAFVAKNPDFNNLKREKDRAAAYMRPQATVTWVTPTVAVPKKKGDLPKSDSNNRFEFKNDSPFALTDVRISLRVEFRGKSDKPLEKAVTTREIAKGQKFEWDSVFNEQPAQVYRMKIVIETDQGRIETEKPLVK